MGRKAHEPDPASRRQVEAMAGFGIPEADIAIVLEVSPKTLRKHYRTELKAGSVKATAKVAENLFRKATGDGREAVIAAIFWLKTRARWRENDPAGGDAAGPLTVVIARGDAGLVGLRRP